MTLVPDADHNDNGVNRSRSVAGMQARLKPTEKRNEYVGPSLQLKLEANACRLKPTEAGRTIHCRSTFAVLTVAGRLHDHALTPVVLMGTHAGLQKGEFPLTIGQPGDRVCQRSLTARPKRYASYGSLIL